MAFVRTRSSRIATLVRPRRSWPILSLLQSGRDLQPGAHFTAYDTDVAYRRAPSPTAGPATTFYEPDGPSKTGVYGGSKIGATCSPGVPAGARSRPDHPPAGRSNPTMPVAKPR